MLSEDHTVGRPAGGKQRNYFVFQKARDRRSFLDTTVGVSLDVTFYYLIRQLSMAPSLIFSEP